MVVERSKMGFFITKSRVSLLALGEREQKYWSEQTELVDILGVEISVVEILVVEISVVGEM